MIIRKLISGGDKRKSRFHTEDDIFIGMARVIRETPVVIAQKARNTIVGSRPVVPWWPLEAIKAVEKHLRPDMRAVEFGSGSSTLWIARRVKRLTARENDEKWAAITNRRIAEQGLQNCEVEFRNGAEYYAFDADHRFDFAVVDGEYRWKCLEELAERMNPGGFIYFDNSDSDKDAHLYAENGLTGSHYAQQVVARLKQRPDVRVEEIHGMINGELYAGSGMLIFFGAV